MNAMADLPMTLVYGDMKCNEIQIENQSGRKKCQEGMF